MSIPFTTLRKKLRQRRLSKDLSQADVARTLSVQLDLPGQWETGKRTPTLGHLEGWLRVLDLRLDLKER